MFPQPMEEVSKLSFALPTWTLKLARLKSGKLGFSLNKGYDKVVWAHRERFSEALID